MSETIYWQDYLPIFMFLALAMLLFTGYPVAFLLGGVAITFGFIGWFFGTFSLIEFYNIIPRIWGGAASNTVLIAVPCFIFMGIMLERSGVAGALLDVLQHLLRRVPAGLALGVTVMATIMAAATGIIGASVTMMSTLALPPMLKRGYQTELSVGTVAASSCLGILIPPSIMLVIMGDLLGISIGKLFVSALVPGFLLAVLYIAYLLTVATVRPEVAPARSEVTHIDQDDILRLFLMGLLLPATLIVLVLGSIFAGFATPTEASAVGAFGATLIAAANRRLTFSALRDAVDRTAITVGMIFFIIIGATGFSYVFRSLGGDYLIVDALNNLGAGPWETVAALMVAIFLMGFFLEWLEITIIVLPIFAPVVAALDFGDHIATVDLVYWFTILIAVNLQTSFLTPPFGYAIFYMKGVAPAGVATSQIYKGIAPFVGIQIVGIAIIMLYPGLVTWLPNAILS